MTTALLIAGWVAAIVAIAYVHDWAVRRRRRGELLAWAARNGVDLTGMTRDECDRMSEILAVFAERGHDLDVVGARVAARQRYLRRVDWEQLATFEDLERRPS